MTLSNVENVFQSGARKMIPAVLVYARRDGQFLMIHKCDRPGDSWHAGKWNGLGGKCEADESALQAAQREFAEEAGVTLPESAFRARGVLHFPNFKPHRSEDWLVTVFEIDYLPKYQEPRTRCDEGDLHWVKEDQLTQLPLWEGDHHFLKFIVAGQPFLGTFWYDGKSLRDHWITGL
jgi:8-oxo-dGTP diphosphatase